jgi:hypothetical protein
MDLRVEACVSGCRRLWALIRGLPPGSAVHRDGKMWSQQDELLATIIERGDHWGHWQTVGTRAFKRGQVPVLPRIEHPDRSVPEPMPDPEPRISTREEVARFMGRVAGEVKVTR